MRKMVFTRMSHMIKRTKLDSLYTYYVYAGDADRCWAQVSGWNDGQYTATISRAISLSLSLPPNRRNEDEK